MTFEEVEQRIEAIKKQATDDDDEVAHVLEDKLFFDALKAIANGHKNPADLAAEVIKTKEIKFSRWTG